MNRFVASLYWNALLQLRNGFYFASLFFVLIWLALLSQFPRGAPVDLGYVIPAFIIANLVTVCFYFVGGLVLLEKAEGTLSSLVVTPLRDAEYLLSKALSLSLLAVVESLAIVIPVYGLGFEPLPLVAGMFMAAGFYCFAGFVAIVRYDSINEYLLPSGAMVAFLMLPLLDYAGLLRSPVFYLHPLQPSLLLMKSAFAPVVGWEQAYGLIGSILWLMLSFTWASRSFYRFVVRTAGG